MKNFHLIFITLITLFYSHFAFAQKDKEAEKQAAFEKVMALLESQDFYFEAQRVSPQNGRNIDLTGDNYTLTIKGNEAEAFLPFFGRAFNPSYGSSEGGIKFEEPMQKVTLKPNEKKKSAVFKFTVTNEQDHYDCILSVTRSGFTSLSVNSQKKSTISFTGKVYPNEDTVQ